MEENFSAALKDIERIHKLSEKEMRAAELADQAAEELAGSEFQHYLNHEVLFHIFISFLALSYA